MATLIVCKNATVQNWAHQTHSDSPRTMVGILQQVENDVLDPLELACLHLLGDAAALLVLLGETRASSRGRTGNIYSHAAGEDRAVAKTTGEEYAGECDEPSRQSLSTRRLHSSRSRGSTFFLAPSLIGVAIGAGKPIGKNRQRVACPNGCSGRARTATVSSPAKKPVRYRKIRDRTKHLGCQACQVHCI